MKQLVTFIMALALYTGASAQCAFDPTITPSAPILCPNESDTLWTQQYDSYQWYKNNVAIPGATNQFLVVSAAQDAGYNFSVEATLNACTEMSPQVLVDSWVFAGATVMTDGPFTVDSMGNFMVCAGDTLLLILMSPYTVNIQWFNNNAPLQGQTNDTLIVTYTGNYTVQGSPAICPNYVANPGVVMSYTFYNCSVGEQEIPNASEITLSPVPANDVLIIRNDNLASNTPFEVYDMQGRVVLTGVLTGTTTEISIGDLSSGIYTLRVNGSEPLKWIKSAN